MKRVLFAIMMVSTMLFSSCAPSAKQMQIFLEQTLTAMPTATRVVTPTSTIAPTPTLIPLEDIPLKEILIENKDYLPTGYDYGQFRSDPPPIYAKITNSKNLVYAQFAHKGETSGGVTVFVFDSIEDANLAYDFVYRGFGENATTMNESTGKVGSVIMDMSVLGKSVQFIEMTFQNCNVVYDMLLSDTTDDNQVRSYINKLMTSMSPYVCK
jgi:hypothetical protein